MPSRPAEVLAGAMVTGAKAADEVSEEEDQDFTEAIEMAEARVTRVQEAQEKPQEKEDLTGFEEEAKAREGFTRADLTARIRKVTADILPERQTIRATAIRGLEEGELRRRNLSE